MKYEDIKEGCVYKLSYNDSIGLVVNKIHENMIEVTRRDDDGSFVSDFITPDNIIEEIG